MNSSQRKSGYQTSNKREKVNMEEPDEVSSFRCLKQGKFFAKPTSGKE